MSSPSGAEVDGRWVSPVIVLWVAGRRSPVTGSSGEGPRRAGDAMGPGLGGTMSTGWWRAVDVLCPIRLHSCRRVRFRAGAACTVSGTPQTRCSPPTAGRRTLGVMTDQDPFARAGQPGEPADSARPAPPDGSASAGCRYDPPRHDAPGYGASGHDASGHDGGRTPENPWQSPTGGDTSGGT